jgi:UDP-GlcNAc:undecaprenyl-phosphate GlcNAc-1-phosphate transferase
VYAGIQGYRLTVVLLAGMAGACLGFLRHNWEPARIFLGDAGALTLGFLVAVAAVQASVKASAAIAILVPILALGLPVMDTVLVMLARFFAAPRKDIASRLLRVGRADLRHVHYLLAERAHSRRKAVLWLYAATLAFCALAVIVATTRSIAMGLTLLVVEFFAVVAIRSLGFASRLGQAAQCPGSGEGAAAPGAGGTGRPDEGISGRVDP